MNRATLRALTVLALLLLAGKLGAQTAQPTPVKIDRAAALRLGAEHGPGVGVAAAPRSATREARSAASRLTRPPVLTLLGGYRNPQSSGGSNLSGPELGVTVSQEVPWRGVGARRAEVADAWGTLVVENTRRARLDAATRAALGWVSCLEAAEILRLRRAAEQQAQLVLRTSEARFHSGAGMPFDVALAKADSATALAAVLDAEGLQVEAHAELRLALGLPASAALEVEGDLFANDDSPAPSSLASATPDAATLTVARARVELSRRETALANAALGPTFTVGASFLREGTGNTIVTGFLGLPLPVIAPAAFDVARQRGVEQVAEAELAQAGAEAEKALSLATHEREHWRDVRAALQGSALQAVHDALRIALAGYEAGTQDVSSVVLARQRVIATEEQLAHVAAAVKRADIRFARLTGALLKGQTP
jgi:outer membrane protein, heavy metal efflux system